MASSQACWYSLSVGETRLHGCSKKQATAPKTEPQGIVELPSTHDLVAVNLVTCFLLHPRLATVGNGLVERLQVFERGLGLVLRCRAKVLEEPPVGRAPGLGALPAKRLGKIFAQKRVGIQREQHAGRIPVHREQLCFT